MTASVAGRPLTRPMPGGPRLQARSAASTKPAGRLRRTLHRLAGTASIALLALGPAAAQGGDKPITPITPITPRLPGAPAIADVDLDEVPVGRALRLLAETYDVSIATGSLPDTRVTIRLRGIGAREAFAAVGAAAGLDVAQEGSIVRVSPKGSEAAARQLVPGPFPAGADDGFDGLHAAGVEVRRIGDGGVLLEGGKNAVEAAALALGNARHHRAVYRVFHLGAAPGEETLKAIQPLLEPHFEAASYNAAENLLTVSALPATLERIEGLVTELTRTPRQFEIEVHVVEVSKNALRQIGSQGTFGLDIRGGVLASTFPLAGLADARRYLPAPGDLAALSRLGSFGGVNPALETGSFGDPGFRFGQIDARGVGLLIQLLEQSGEARVVATPKVTALDNRRARISMVTTLRIPTFTQNQAFATTTVTGIEQVDVGTTLEVRPRRGNGRQILLTVTPEVSELQPNTSVFAQNGLTQGLPIVTRRRTETEVILNSGETLVIGGLVTEHKTETHGKTPGLANLPLIGRAFRLEDKKTESTELLVFVTPRELPPPEERRGKVRVDDTWIPTGLAAQIDGTRALLRSQSAADRVAAVRALEQIDADLFAAGVDAGPDVAALGGDTNLEVRAAAALFLLHSRPADALGKLARFKDSRTVALSALAAPMAPHLRAALAELVGQSLGPGGTAELLAGRPPVPLPDGLAERVRAMAPAAAVPAPTEPALSWSGTPAEIALRGDAAGTELVRAALDLLARRAPDLRHLVGFGLAEIEAGAAGPAVDPAVRGAHVAIAGGTTAQSVALQLVRLATLVFQSRVRGLPAAGGSNLAQAVRQEIYALERLTGAPCPPQRAASAVRDVLATAGRDALTDASGGEPAASPSRLAMASPAARDALEAGLRWIAADAPATAIGTSAANPSSSPSTGGRP
jgi:type II secretory pathway component GspD/PulD (secretin)